MASIRQCIPVVEARAKSSVARLGLETTQRPRGAEVETEEISSSLGRLEGNDVISLVHKLQRVSPAGFVWCLTLQPYSHTGLAGTRVDGCGETPCVRWFLRPDDETDASFGASVCRFWRHLRESAAPIIAFGRCNRGPGLISRNRVGGPNKDCFRWLSANGNELVVLAMQLHGIRKKIRSARRLTGFASQVSPSPIVVDYLNNVRKRRLPGTKALRGKKLRRP